MALFVDLGPPQLESVVHTFDERYFPANARILLQGLRGSAFFVIVEGEATVLVDGEARATLGKGDFFGEISVLLSEPPVADVVSSGTLRCLALDGPSVEAFLLMHPSVMYRMLQAQARRLRSANRSRG